MASQEYFAAKESTELVKHVTGFLDKWNNTIGTSQDGLAAVWFRNLRFYYSNLFYGAGTDSSLEYTGTQGELIKMVVPQARSLNTQFLSLTTKQKLSFESEASSTEAQTIADTRVSDSLIKQVVRDAHLDSLGYRMAEQASVLGVSYMKPCWDMLKGKPVAADPDTGEIMYSGDIDLEVLSVFDVIYDTTKEDFYKQDYVVCRKIRNRWDLIAKYPKMAEEIKRLPAIARINEYDMMWQQHYTEDSIFVFEFYHKSTPALPNGRMTVFSDKDTIFFDDNNPYINPDGDAYIPLAQMKPEPISGTGFGYPFFSNILPLQELLDHGFSAAASNQAAFAVQSVLNPIGNDISVSNIGQLRFVNYRPMADASGGKPEALQLSKTSPETFKFIDMIRSYMMEIYNISGALRGSPPPGVTAASAIATLTTNSLEFSQSFSKAYVDTLETAMSMVIWQYATLSTEAMVVSIAGQNKASSVKEFLGKDLQNIKRVSSRIQNPLMATSAGKFEVANELMKNGQIKDVNKYFQILEGAPLDALTDIDFNQGALIQSENDAMRDGTPVKALITDNHPKHIINHLSLLDDVLIRNNSAMVQIVLDHVLDHRDQASQLAMDPLLLGMLQTGQIPQGAAQPPEPAPTQGAEPAEPAESLAPQSAAPLSDMQQGG